MTESDSNFPTDAPLSTASEVRAADPLLEVYKMTVEMADRVSARRATANAFFLTLNSALLATLGILRPATGGAQGVMTADRFGLVLLSLAGLILSLTWWALLRSYRQLNRAKFRVIGALERELPVAPFGDEWKYLEGDRSSRPWARYLELGQAERIVPLVYAALYVAAGVRAVVA